MSLNDSISSDQCELEEEKCTCERAKTEVTVDSMIKWVSSLEDKVVDSTKRIEERLEFLITNQQILSDKNTELVRCNRLLAQELSKRLFRAEFKQRRILNPLAEEVVQGALHPNVIPFVYLEKKELAVTSK